MQVIYTTWPSSVCLWRLRQWEPTRSCHGWVHIVYHAFLWLNLQLHTIDLVRTCRISSLCTVAWQLARFQSTRRIARSLGDSGAFCSFSEGLVSYLLCSLEVKGLYYWSTLIWWSYYFHSQWPMTCFFASEALCFGGRSSVCAYSLNS